MRNRWMDIEQLKKDRKSALKRVKADGIILCFDPDERKKAKELFLPVMQVLQDDLKNSSLSLIFIYRQSEQKGVFAECDGLCFTSSGEDAASIGISTELINGSREYAYMVILHEITHLLLNNRDVGFFGKLDDLIRRFNEAAGCNVVNDYAERVSDTLVKTVRGGKGDEH